MSTFPFLGFPPGTINVNSNLFLFLCFSFTRKKFSSVEEEAYQKAAKVFNLHCKHDLFAGKVFNTLTLFAPIKLNMNNMIVNDNIRCSRIKWKKTTKKYTFSSPENQDIYFLPSVYMVVKKNNRECFSFPRSTIRLHLNHWESVNHTSYMKTQVFA